MFLQDNQYVYQCFRMKMYHAYKHQELFSLHQTLILCFSKTDFHVMYFNSFHILKLLRYFSN